MCFVDIKECASSPCHINASCTELEPAFSCVCDEHFTGNGTHLQNTTHNETFNGDVMNGICLGFFCEDINECLLDDEACDENSTCINLIGSHSCECKDGFRFSSDLERCVEIRELKLRKSGP